MISQCLLFKIQFMKKITLFFSFLTIIVLESFQCSKNQYYNPEVVVLSATLNNTAETINLGDTLKFKLTVPDVLLSTTQSVPVNNLQSAFYTFVLYKIDTLTKMGTRITGNNIFTTEGSTNGYSVYVSNNNKPFNAILNILPSERGIYYMEVIHVPGTIKVNNSYEAALRVKFAITNIHSTMMAYYLSPAFAGSMDQSQNEGYGFYAFKVN